MIKAIILVAILALSACVSTPPAPVKNPRQVWCDNNSPRFWSDEQIDAMTDGQVIIELAYQDKGEKWCGW